MSIKLFWRVVLLGALRMVDHLTFLRQPAISLLGCRGRSEFSPGSHAIGHSFLWSGLYSIQKWSCLVSKVEGGGLRWGGERGQWGRLNFFWCQYCNRGFSPYLKSFAFRILHKNCYIISMWSFRRESTTAWDLWNKGNVNTSLNFRHLTKEDNFCG